MLKASVIKILGLKSNLIPRNIIPNPISVAPNKTGELYEAME